VGRGGVSNKSSCLSVYSTIFRSWAYKHFTEFHYDTAEGVVIFQCYLRRLGCSLSPPLHKSMLSRPLISAVHAEFRLLAHGVPHCAVTGVMWSLWALLFCFVLYFKDVQLKSGNPECSLSSIQVKGNRSYCHPTLT
jgi:hypothetical protein